jgi:hypothetical protein
LISVQGGKDLVFDAGIGFSSEQTEALEIHTSIARSGNYN